MKIVRILVCSLLPLLYASGCNNAPQEGATPDAVSRPSSGTNGLSEVDRQVFYHTPEGSELVPMSWMRALQVPDKTGTEQPFMDNLERFGLLPDDNPASTNHLPVGLTSGPRLGVDMLGVNCTACHVGQLEYKGSKRRIDGAPNMFDIVGFYGGILEALGRLSNPTRIPGFIRRLSEQEHGFGALTAAKYTEKNLGLAKSYAAMLRRLGQARENPRLGDAIGGPGRTDAFGAARILLFGSANRNTLDAPASYPFLWGLDKSEWLHWPSNTNSVMQRNIGEALGLGGSVDLKTGQSSLDLRALHTLEELVYKITPPVWPEDIFPKIDHAGAARGKALYDVYCWRCHDDYGEPVNNRFTYKTFRPGNLDGSSTTAADDIGTDPREATNFAARLKPVSGQSNSDLSFARSQVPVLEKIEKFYYDANKISPQTQEEWNSNRGKEIWRDMFDMEGKAYAAKPLAGIWATAPYLHNGSVPTIYDLLSPVQERSPKFMVGHREYDPVRLGYTATAPAGSPYPSFELDTTNVGNANFGHEIRASGPRPFTNEEKMDLIEYIKTIKTPVQKGAYQPGR
jgi:hypothetical protein